jgi:broad specificity phosphatase PhoE
MARARGASQASILASQILAGFGVEAEPDCDLLEWNYGRYEGVAPRRSMKSVRLGNLFREGCPGGEAPNQVGAWADRIVERVRMLLFSSGHFLRVLAAHWLGLDAEAGRLFTLDTASLSILGYEHGQSEPAIRLWNDTGHVEGRFAPAFAH